MEIKLITELKLQVSFFSLNFPSTKLTLTLTILIDVDAFFFGDF